MYEIRLPLQNRNNPNAKPTWNISDYTICQMDDEIIVFHLDLHNGLGVTINSIFKSKELSKKFTHIIKVPYTIAVSEEEIEEYFESDEYLEKAEKEHQDMLDNMYVLIEDNQNYLGDI